MWKETNKKKVGRRISLVYNNIVMVSAVRDWFRMHTRDHSRARCSRYLCDPECRKLHDKGNTTISGREWAFSTNVIWKKRLLWFLFSVLCTELFWTVAIVLLYVFILRQSSQLASNLKSYCLSPLGCWDC